MLEELCRKEQKKWSYPDDIKDDLLGQGLAEEEREEALASAWEYVRSVVPEYTNWRKYMALTRLTTLAAILEYRGDLFDLTHVLKAGETLLGYDVHALIHVLFGETEAYDAMLREYLSSILIMAEKTRNQPSDFLQRFTHAFATSPANFYRMRDCDGQWRFFMACAIACNDRTDWLTEEEYQIMSELATTLYDSVAFYKHRAESEIANLYAYCGYDREFRVEVYERARSAVWAIDLKWCRNVGRRAAVNMVRHLPLIHMGMRRYRYVEDGLVVGKPETEKEVEDARKHVKLWYRIDAPEMRENGELVVGRYQDIITRAPHLLYPGLAEVLTSSEDAMCRDCKRPAVYGTAAAKQFGGVILCLNCQERWRAYVRSAWIRFQQHLPSH